LGVLGANAEAYLQKHPDAAANAPAGAKGVYVGQVRPNSVAEKSGLKPGDIIAGMAGKRVRDMAMLDQMIETLKPGDGVELRVIRGGDEQSVRLQF
jgi:S1-C subfamily serine protease